VTSAAIELEDVVVARGGKRILDVERLTIGAGQFVGVIGRNGAGKSTLLHVLAGLIRPTRGVVRHDGLAVTSLSGWRRTAIRRRVGFVPQATEYHADLPLTVHEVIAMGCAGPTGLLRRLDAGAKRRVGAWLDRLGLVPMADRTFRSLSGGEQQKVLLARAMVQGPRLLLLDEPAANLDLDWKERVVEWLDQVFGEQFGGADETDAGSSERPLTVVMVSHETGLLPACCEQVALMAGGRIVRYGPPSETLTPEALAGLYGCRVEVVQAAGRRHAVPGGSSGS